MQFQPNSDCQTQAMQAQDQTRVLQFLPVPKGLQTVLVARRNSLYPLLDNPLDEEDQQTSPELFNQNKQPDHQQCNSVRSFPELFSKVVYKSHNRLNIMNHDRFCELQLQEGDENKAERTVLDNQELVFESKFECGNLALAAVASPGEYNLCLHRDINCASPSTQWFFFRVRNRFSGKFRFNIVNFVKPYSAYQDGLKVLVFRQGAWRRSCSDISYTRNSLEGRYYTLSFSYDLQEIDEVYFAHCYPYSYSRLQRYLGSLERRHPSTLHRRKLANSALNNRIDLLTISSGNRSNKPTVFLTARAHPGESPASFVMQGFLDCLLGTDSVGHTLREQFTWKVVPMLNPDGVIHGNYRCGITGVDLNRSWLKPSVDRSPEVLALQELMRTCETATAFLDFHGHSKKRGVFAYGCAPQACPYVAKEFPYLLHTLINEFSYSSCNFAVQPSREGTGRVWAYRRGIANSYTIECSFMGPWRQRTFFAITDYFVIGRRLAEGFYHFFCRKDRLPLRDLYASAALLGMGDGYEEGDTSEDEQPKASRSVTISPRIEHRAPRTISPVGKIPARSRLLHKRPKLLVSTLNTMVAEINLSEAPPMDPVPLIVALGHKFGRTLEIMDNFCQQKARYSTGTFRPSMTSRPVSNSVIKVSNQRNAYRSYRRNNYSIEIGRTKIYM